MAEAIEENVIGYSAQDMTPIKIRSFCYDAEEVVTVYRAMSTYLKVLSQQPEEDLDMIARVTRLMIAIKPQAVEASQEIAKATITSS